MLLVAGVSAQSVRVMNLWPKGAPHRGNPNDTAKVWIYLPADKKVTGRSVVICPGGGYTNLAIDHEGHEWAKFFQNMGITAFVLKYRMPNGKPEIPIEDAEEAIRMVRRNAMTWHLKSNEVGIMGSYPSRFTRQFSWQGQPQAPGEELQQRPAGEPQHASGMDSLER